VGRVLADWGEWRVGVRETAGNADLRVGDPAAFDIEDYRKGELFLRIAADTLDSLAFPRSGVLGSGELRLSRPDLLRADEDFDQLELSTAYAKTWGRHTLLSTLRFDTTLEGQVSLLNQFRLGGFLDLSGLNRDQLNGQHVLRVGTSYYRRIGNLALFPAFAGISIELGNTWDARSDIGLSDAIWGGSFWTGVDTPVGPVYMGYGVAEGGVNAFYVFLGRPF
jgi:NTE family protein